MKVAENSIIARLIPKTRELKGPLLSATVAWHTVNSKVNPENKGTESQDLIVRVHRTMVK